MECKSSSGKYNATIYVELIDTLWNVNMQTTETERMRYT